MPSTDSHHPEADTAGQGELDPQTANTVEQTSTTGWKTLQVSAFVLWVGVGSYAWFRSMQPTTYMIGVVGATLGLTLATALAGHITQKHWSGTITRQSKRGRLLVGGCLAGVVGGSLAVALSADQLGVSQPAVSTLTAGGALLLGGSLLVVAARQSTALAGLAGIGLVISLANASSVDLVAAGVFGTNGIYGPLTQAAVTWIAPLCLLVGCWRAAGVEQQLTRWTASVETWPDTDREARRLVAGVGCAMVLTGWQTGTVGPWAVVGLAVVPSGLVGVALVRSTMHGSTATGLKSRLSSSFDRRLSSSFDRRLSSRFGRRLSSSFGRRLSTSETASGWTEPALLVGGPLGVMALFGLGYRLPVGTVLVAGCLCCFGACLLQAYLPGTDRQSTGLRAGVGTILDGSVSGVQLLCRLLVPLLVVGGTVGILEAAGVGTWLIAGVVWLSGGHPVGVVLVVAGCCVALGAALPLIGGYAVGALLGVSLLQLLAPVSELTAHIVVISAVVVGWLLAVRYPQTSAIIGAQAKQ